MSAWYPENKTELEKTLNKFLDNKTDIVIPKNILGLIVPHAGYAYSGAIAGKAFSLLENKRFDKAIIIGPSHYFHTFEALTPSEKIWKTPIGEINLFNTDFKIGNLEQEHSIKNQVPFLQSMGINEIMPIMIGEITDNQAKDYAKKLADIDALYVFSTDLSHFFEYKKAAETDRRSIDILEKLDNKKFKDLDACGFFPLKIMFELCKIKKTRPHLIEYKNSGDVTGDKSSVVGYASFYF